MAGLQRSAETFRRSGSSGLVWEDRFSGNLNQDKDKDNKAAELRHSRSVGSTGMLERSLSKGGGRGYRTMGVELTLDPPSPKVSGCGFCSAFGKSGKSKKSKPRNKRNK